MSLFNGPPTDPSYLAFVGRLPEVVTGANRTSRLRWSPKTHTWDPYPEAEWLLDDPGIPDTPPGSAISGLFGEVLTTSMRIEERNLPDLWNRISASYAVNALRYPNIVWSPWGGGDWRNPVKRPAGTGPDDKKQKDEHELPEPCVKRIKDVRAYLDQGYITHDQAQRLIDKIVAECT